MDDLQEPSDTKKLSWAERLKKSLTKSRDKVAKSLATLVGAGEINDELYEDLESILISADIGVEATNFLLEEIRKKVTLKGLNNANELKIALKEALYELILPLEKPLLLDDIPKPFVILMVGINGAGKTTSIGKLAKIFQLHDKKVILAAGDTFRAAAKEQLIAWGIKNNITVITQSSSDAASVCYDSIESAKAKNIDIVLADTAGRLPTQTNLMAELKKIKRVIQKSMEDAPHEILLVVDANIGQNTINQVIAFDEALNLTGIILTKLDGSAKGGVIAALAKKHPIPIKYIGIGEGIDDLKPFNAKEYVNAFIG